MSSKRKVETIGYQEDKRHNHNNQIQYAKGQSSDAVYSSSLSHLLNLLHCGRSNKSTINYSPPSANTITHLLQTRGTLEEMISSQNSNHIEKHISQLTSISLTQLFSVLMEKEILCESSMRDYNSCKIEDTSLNRGNGNRFIKRRTNVHSVLLFVERVLQKRYYRESKSSLTVISSHANTINAINAVDEWVDRQKLNNRFHCKHFCIPQDGHENGNSYGNGSENGDTAEELVTCVSFMMAYTAIYERLQSKNFASSTSSEKCRVGKPSSSSSVDALIAAGSDTIINVALRSLFMILCIARNLSMQKTSGKRNRATSCNLSQTQPNVVFSYHDGNRSVNRTKIAVESVLDKCFKKHLSKIDSFTLSIRKARLQKKSSLSVRPQIRREPSNIRIRPIDILLEEMQNDKSFTQDSHISAEDELKLSLTLSCDGLSQLDYDKDSKSFNSIDKGKTSIGIQTISPFMISAGEIRANLLGLTRSATTVEVKTLSDNMADLIQRVGADFGADGIMTIGSIIIEGQSDNDTSARDPLPFSLFSDTLLSNLCKSCVTGETSTVRASAFIYSFVLPHVDALKSHASHPPSRLMISTISGLVRDRHVECIESLFIPILCRTEPPSQSQCELVGRIIKSVTIPKDTISLFVSKILRKSTSDLKGKPLINMIWSDYSIPILTCCLQKKPILHDEMIVSISQQIERYSKNAIFTKSVKFSTLFNTLVTKFGRQLKKSGSLDLLHESSGRLKTFLGKSILSSLKKL